MTANDRAAGKLRVLTVCTGNICRSPMMEQMLRARLGDLSEYVDVSSAGTRARDGDEMTAQAAELSERYTGLPAAHRARLLRSEHVEASDLVLTATREHRSAVVSLYPRASRYTFTLKQFVVLSTAASADEELSGSTNAFADSSRDFVSRVAGFRGQIAPVNSLQTEDIEDPYRRSDEVYQAVGQEINASINAVVVQLLRLERRGSRLESGAF